MKRLLGACTALVLALGVTACGGGGSATLTQKNFFDEIVAAQAAAKTSVMTMTVEQNGQNIVMTGTSEVGKDGSDVSFDMTMDMGDSSMHLIMVDGILYLNMAELTQGKFFPIDPKDEDNPLASQFESMADQGDPSAQLRQMEKAVVDWKKVGDGPELDGVSTTEYEVTIDLNKLGDEEAASDSAEAEEVVYSMWVGEDNLMRKMSADANGGTVEVLWTKWGDKVSITAPADDETITDLPSLLGGADD